jgi:hypothetical protein
MMEIKPQTKIMLMTAYGVPSLKDEDRLPVVKYEDNPQKTLQVSRYLSKASRNSCKLRTNGG